MSPGVGAFSPVGLRKVAGLAATDGLSLDPLGIVDPPGDLRLSYFETMSLMDPFLLCRGRSGMGIDKPFPDDDSGIPAGGDCRTLVREEEDGGKLYIDAGLVLALSEFKPAKPCELGFAATVGLLREDFLTGDFFVGEVDTACPLPVSDWSFIWNIDIR